ncbi:MAG: putative hydroxymethylpyrimidine transport system substrate-binding protein [Solirubrobacteraceae bacterium]|nr:putative hydroxymethylpyrimidine transport system substrate-binding protein [Solirubrobacteraceae bacterium]
MRRLAAVLASLALILVAGCGEKDESAPGGGKTQKFNIILDYFPNADHAGIYAAQAAGDYARAGLDVEVKPPPDPSAPLKLLQSGQADVVISYEPELLLARDKGANLVSVGALVQKPLTTLMSLKDIASPQDLAGKRVGTAGLPYQSAYLQTILRNAGVDPTTVKETNVGFNLVPAMLSDKVDATLGAFWNYEGEDLKRRGRHPKVLRMEKLGVPTYDELIVVARRKDLDENFSSKLRRFLRATASGHERLRADPEIGVGALLKVDPGLERGLQTAVVSATLPVFFPADKAKPFGWQQPAEWDAYGRWMYANKLLKRQPDASSALTNEFLPGQGLDPGTSAAP